jgi:hypothetical protein
MNRGRFVEGWQTDGSALGVVCGDIVGGALTADGWQLLLTTEN